MIYHGSSENGINWADGHIEYKDLHTVFTEAVAGFAHIYTNGVAKVTFLSSLTGRTIHNVEDVDCPSPVHSIIITGVPCHAINSSNVLALPKRQLPYDWLMHYLQTKDYIQCPSIKTRYTASFIAAL
jgi:hypothetical protein